MQNISAVSYQLPIQKKLMYLSCYIAVGIIAFFVFFYYSFSSSLEQEKKTQSKNFVESSLEILNYYNQRYLANELTLQEAQTYAGDVLSSSSYGENGYVWVSSTSGTIIVQPYIVRLIGKNMYDWQDSTGQYIFRDFAHLAEQGGGWITYFWPKKKSNIEYSKIAYVANFEPWGWLVGSGVYLDEMKNDIFWAVAKTSGILVLGFIIFIALAMLTINHLIKQLSSMAIRDGLTDLYSKRFLQEIIPSISAKNCTHDHVLATLFIDIDHFKIINDSYGHARGDDVLVQVAKVIKNTCKRSDYCFRYGGEEFLVIAAFKDKNAAKTFAENIRSQIEQLRFQHNKINFNTTVSIGIAIYNHADNNLHQTLDRADGKLYKSKMLGRNCVSD